jgi:hypothetical protein
VNSSVGSIGIEAAFPPLSDFQPSALLLSGLHLTIDEYISRRDRAALVRYQEGHDTTRFMSPAHSVEWDNRKIGTKCG